MSRRIPNEKEIHASPRPPVCVCARADTVCPPWRARRPRMERVVSSRQAVASARVRRP